MNGVIGVSVVVGESKREGGGKGDGCDCNRPRCAKRRPGLMNGKSNELSEEGEGGLSREVVLYLRCRVYKQEKQHESVF